MANNIVEGLFGLTPSQVQQQQQAQIDAAAQQYARAAPFERATAQMYRGGAGLAGLGAGMLGMENPQMAAAQRTQALAQGGDLTTPEGLFAKAEQFRAAGDQQTALKLVMLGKKMQAEELEARQSAEVKSTEMARNLAQAAKAQEPPKEEMTADMKNAAALADSVADRGTPEWKSVYMKNLTQLTAKGEGGAVPNIVRLQQVRKQLADVNPNDPRIAQLDAAIRKETYIKPENEPQTGMKPADELRFMNQHSKDYERAVVTIDSSSDALRITESIEKNPKFGYLFGGYTEAALSKLAPGEIAGLQSEINTLKSNLMSTGLNLVKAANSAGIGAITVKEWPIFERMIADLDPKMDEKTARKKFAEIKNFFDGTQKRSSENYKKKWGKKTDFYDPSVEEMIRKPADGGSAATGASGKWEIVR